MTNKKPHLYWFKRRRWGWGWVPVTWQGWLVISLFLAIVLYAALQLPAKPEQPTSDEFAKFFLTVGGAIVALVMITALTGPRPHWRWGKKPNDNPDEDY